MKSIKINKAREHNLKDVSIELEADMKDAAENLDFEKAISIREQIKRLEKEIKK